MTDSMKDIAKQYKETMINFCDSEEHESHEEEKKENSKRAITKIGESAFSAFELGRKRAVLELILKDIGLEVTTKTGFKKLPPKRILHKVNAR